MKSGQINVYFIGYKIVKLLIDKKKTVTRLLYLISNKYMFMT